MEISYTDINQRKYIVISIVTNKLLPIIDEQALLYLGKETNCECFVFLQNNTLANYTNMERCYLERP